MKRINLVGQRFGKLIVVSLAGKNKWGNLKFLCKCNCGKEKIISSTALRDAGQYSCGCIQITHQFTINQKQIRSKELRFYHRYQIIKDRCVNPNNPSYKNYGGRGIKFLWKSFEEFRDDMYESYKPELTIDRIDVNGHYSKENCRWATMKEQARNVRRNKMYKFNGEKLCFTDWAIKFKMPKSTLFNRLKRGWSIEKALSTKVR